jgi:hypothetical protein
MVVFQNGFADELATQQLSAKGLDASAGGKRPLCPLQHEDGCVDGQPSLAYRLWQLLDWAGASGLQTSVLTARTGCSLDDVQTTLNSSRYFIQLPGELRLGRISSLATYLMLLSIGHDRRQAATMTNVQASLTRIAACSQKGLLYALAAKMKAPRNARQHDHLLVPLDH